jgi:hypothetical protein
MEYVSASNVKRMAVALLACAALWHFSQLAAVATFAVAWYLTPKA